MKKLFPTLLICIFSLLVHAGEAEMVQKGASAPPQPPQTNPHPAQTPEDIKRVEFAVKSVETFLKKELPLHVQANLNVGNYLSKDEKCITDKKCYEQDRSFVDELNRLYKAHGVVTILRHPHIIPWSWEKFKNNKSSPTVPSKPLPSVQPAKVPDELMGPQLKKDEYMIHIYVIYSKHPADWYHLNVILSEDDKGQIFFKYFYTTPMPRNNANLPDGVVC